MKSNERKKMEQGRCRNINQFDFEKMSKMREK